MQIDFRKIKGSTLDIDYSKDSSSIVGTIERVDRDSVKLESNFSTELELICNRCGKEFKREFNYPLELLLTDGVYSDPTEINIIEFNQGKIDFDYLLNSEIASIEEDYNYCDSCQDREDFEIEF
jgi:uncharacterized metal-binding protein YceD (DUF177 family)